MQRRRIAGFSLIELLIVMAVIMILASIALPNFLIAQQRAREASATGMLRTLRVEQEDYRIRTQQYADRFALLTDFGQASSPRGGADVIVHLEYIYRLRRPAPEQWNCTAEPVRARTSSKFFYVDQTGVIRVEIGKMPSSTSPSL